MNHKKIIELDAGGRCFHEFEYMGQSEPVLAAGHMDVTARTDGPFRGKIYDRQTDTFSDPPPPPEETEEEEESSQS